MDGKNDLFVNSGRLPDNADLYGKTSALAADYFRMGKSVDWVIENVCGKNKAQRRLVLSMAQTQRIITSEQRKQLGVKYLGEKDTDKFKRK